MTRKNAVTRRFRHIGTRSYLYLAILTIGTAAGWEKKFWLVSKKGGDIPSPPGKSRTETATVRCFYCRFVRSRAFLSHLPSARFSAGVVLAWLALRPILFLCLLIPVRAPVRARENATVRLSLATRDAACH